MSDMEARLNKLESKQELTEVRVNELDKNSALFKQSLDSFNIALEKFGAIVNHAEESLTAMDKRVTLIENKVENDVVDMGKMKKSFDEHNEKQKVDIMDIIKNKWEFLMLLGYVVLNHLGWIK